METILTSRAKKALKILIKYRDTNNCVYLPNLPMQLNIHSYNHEIEHLISLKYAILLSASDYIDDVKLTYDGLNYFSVKQEKLKEFIFKSIFVPIIISFFTSAITTFVALFINGMLLG